jgi:spermidine/putrescine-binding protein
MMGPTNGVKIDRRQLIRQGLQVGAALGMAGLAGITLVEAGSVEAATTAPPINPNAPEWVPSVTPRKVRKYRWEALAAGEQAAPTGLELRTIGLGVTVQDRFLNEFTRRTGHRTHGKVTTLTSMITEWLAGGWKSYDTEETNANRSSALWDAHLVQPIPVEKVIPWRYARPTFVSKKAGGYDPHSGWPLVEVWVNPDDQREFKLVPQVYNCDSVAYRPDLLQEDVYTWGALVDPKYKGKVGILNDSLITPGWCAGWMKFNVLPI